MGQSRLSFRSISAWAAVLLALSLAADAGAAQMGSTFTNSIGMEFVRIPAGSFLMGRAEDPPDPCAGGRPQVASGLALHDKGCDEEKPQHRVTISRPFYIGKYGVTQEQWCRVMGNNPAIFQSETAGTDWKRHPVENVSWQAAQAF
jgi:sulfatase modifying factor 1